MEKSVYYGYNNADYEKKVLLMNKKSVDNG